MFALSAKAVYGLTAVMELGIRNAAGPVQIREIANEHSIPQHYLEQLLVLLKRKGIVASFRGARGGYALASSPSEIRVLDILEALDGPLSLLQDRRRDSAIAFFAQDVEDGLRERLDVSLEELVLRKQQNDEKFIYTI